MPSTNLNQLPAVSDPEHATILAALRFYQREYRLSDQNIDDIVTNGGEFTALDAVAIDELAERINCETFPASEQ